MIATRLHLNRLAAATAGTLASIAVSGLVLFSGPALATQPPAFPAPLPGQSNAFPAPLPGEMTPSSPANKPLPFPSAGGADGAPAAFPSGGAVPLGGGFSPAAPQQQAGPPGAEQCMKEFLPLRQAAEKRAEVIQSLGKRKAPASEACKAIGAFAQAEIRMIKFVEANAQKCGIPEQAGKQMAANHKNTEAMRVKVCNVAAQQEQQRGPAAPSLSEALGAAIELPEATPTRRHGGSTFDTLSGNVLAR